MLGRKIWLIGGAGDFAASGDLDGERVSPGEIRRALRPCSAGSLLTVGPLAAVSVDPGRMAPLVHKPYVSVLVVAASHRERAKWRTQSWAEVVQPSELRDRLAVRCVARAHRVLPLRVWAPRLLRRDPGMAKALRALSRSPAPAFVEQWMRHLGRDRHFVTRHLARTDWTAKALCLVYARAYRAHEERRGIPAGWISARLGYSRVSRMHEALGPRRASKRREFDSA